MRSLTLLRKKRAQTQAGPTEQVDNPSPVSWLVALSTLALINLVCFYPTLKETSFYLDDWTMLNVLSSGPDNFLELLRYYFNNEVRVICRPLEALHLAGMFSLFGTRAFGYHILNLILETTSAFLFYLCLSRVFRNQVISLVAAACFLLYPSHNVTHYWVVAGSVSMSMVLYFSSLLASIYGYKRDSLACHLGAALLYGCSLLNYEVFLPLAMLNVGIVFIMGDTDNKAVFTRALRTALIFGATIAAFVAYVKLIVPYLAPSFVHPASFDLSVFVNTIVEGIRLSLPAFSFPFFFDRASDAIESPWTRGVLQQSALVAYILLAGVIAMALCRTDADKRDSSSRKRFAMLTAILGACVVVASYSIFGLNPEYFPTLETILNRINAGASVGIVIIFAAFLYPVQTFFSPSATSRRAKLINTIVPLVVSLPLVYLFTAANVGQSTPWRLSHITQSHIVSNLEKNKDRLKDAKAIILAGCPRYVNDAPVFDGVWDFQQVVRLKLGRRDLKGGVISDRMDLSGPQIRDISMNYVIASYDYDGLYLLISPQCDFVKIESPSQLIDVIEKRGMQFELNKKLPDIWREQVRSRTSNL